MDEFTKNHLRSWIADHRYSDEDEDVLFEAMSRIVADDPRFLDDGWDRVAREARRRGA